MFSRGTVGDEFTHDLIEAFESIEKGVTTRAEVAERLGAPQNIVAAAGREIYHYNRYDAKLGLVLFFSRVNVTSDNLYILFDKQGIVEDVIFGKRTDRLEFQFWPFGD